MALDGNITSVSITDSDLSTRRSALDRYRADSQQDWSAQRTAAQTDALSEFHAVHGHDPEWCKAIRDEDWQRVLVYYTLTLIFEGLRGDAEREEEDKWRGKAHAAMKSFRYRFDADESGTLEDTVTEGPRAVGEVMLVR